MSQYDFERKAILAKPCPFCGSKKVKTEKREHFYAMEDQLCTYIACADCGAEVFGMPVRDEKGQYVRNYSVAQHQALKVWNRRAS